MPGLKPNIFSASNAGMTRLRVKGGASGDALYELTNGFVNADRMPQRRPGTSQYAHLTGAQAGKTHGLVAFAGQLYKFTFFASAILAGPPVSVVRLIYPTVPVPGGVDIKQIHFAKPYMGLLYVVCEFTDGVVAHYWLQNPKAWQQFHVYAPNELVQPSAVNGYYYKAVLTNPPPAWQPNHQYNLGDEIQPTTYNGFSYTAQTMLPNPSGPEPSTDTEPLWIAQAGALIVEATSTDKNTNALPVPPALPDTQAPGTAAGGKYSNPGGSGARSIINPVRTP